MELLDVIKNIQLSLHYSRINCGGCIHFAYYLSNKLSENGIKHKIVGIVDTRLNLATTQNIGCKHVVVFISKIGYIDSNQICSSIENFNYWHSKALNLNFDLDKFRKKNIWNSSYNRNYNSTISRVLNSGFKHLTK